MKILQVHNEYIYRGGEETVLTAEKELLTRNGHTVHQIIRSNKIEIKNLFEMFLYSHIFVRIISTILLVQ